jgi:hypothetical protein
MCCVLENSLQPGAQVILDLHATYWVSGLITQAPLPPARPPQYPEYPHVKPTYPITPTPMHGRAPTAPSAMCDLLKTRFITHHASHTRALGFPPQPSQPSTYPPSTPAYHRVPFGVAGRTPCASGRLVVPHGEGTAGGVPSAVPHVWHWPGAQGNAKERKWVEQYTVEYGTQPLPLPTRRCTLMVRGGA